MVVRIMVMVPIYAIASFISLFSLEAAFVIDAVRDIYEVRVLLGEKSAFVFEVADQGIFIGIRDLLLLQPSFILPRRRTIAVDFVARPTTENTPVPGEDV